MRANHKTNRLDKLYQQAVQKRDNNMCRVCGRPSTCAHHIIHRTCKTLRYSLENGLSLCQHHHNQVHQDPAFMEHVHTLADFEDLRQRGSVLAVGANRIDEKEIEKRLKEFLCR